MKTFKKILTAALGVLPVIYTAVAVFFFMPETVALHFGADGTPDRFGSRFEAFIFPALIIVFFLIFFFIRKKIAQKSSENTERTERNLDVTDTVILCVLILLNAVWFMILPSMIDPKIMTTSENIIFVVESVVIGILFIVVGNIMPKTKRNKYIGVMRFGFAMESDENWYITNRAGGIAMVAAGLVTVAAGLILRSLAAVYVMLISLIVFLTVAILYSYGKIKKKSKH